MAIYPFFYRHVISHLPEKLVEGFGGPFMAFLSLFQFSNVKLPFSMLGLNFSNPVGMSSGWADNPHKMSTAFGLGCGIVTSKTVTFHKREGNPRPWYIRNGATLINSMGLPNKGLNWWVENYQKPLDYPSIVSIRGENLNEWVALIEGLESRVDIFELNFSCPNLPGGVLDIKLSTKIVEDIVGVTDKKIWLKLSPEYTVDENVKFVHSVRDKIDGITAINTVPIEHQRLGNPTKQGGLSGPNIHLDLLSILKELRKNYPSFQDLPIFAVGGIDSNKKAWDILHDFKSLPLSLTGFLMQGPYFYQKLLKYIRRQLQDLNVDVNSLLK